MVCNAHYRNECITCIGEISIMLDRHEDVRAMVDMLTIAQVRHKIEVEYGLPLWYMPPTGTSLEDWHRDQLFETILEHDAMGDR